MESIYWMRSSDDLRDGAYGIRKIRISLALFCTDFADSRRIGRPPVTLELLPLLRSPAANTCQPSSRSVHMNVSSKCYAMHLVSDKRFGLFDIGQTGVQP